MNKKYDDIEEETKQILDHARYAEGSKKYNDACDAFESWKSVFANEENQIADEKFELTQKLFRAAINSYSTIENPDLKKEYLGKTYFNLIAALAQNRKSDPSDTIKAINEAEDLGLVSKDWDYHISNAYYNSGIKQIDLESKIESFSQAKIYDSTNAKAIYCLGIAYMSIGEHNKAKKEFETILYQELLTEKFSLEMRLNSWCQLKDCQSELHEDTSNTLELAWQFIRGLPQKFFTDAKPQIQEFRHKMANEICIDYIIKNSSKVDITEFGNFLYKFNSEFIEAALRSLNNELSALLQKDCTEDANHLGELIINISKVVGETKMLSCEDTGYND